MSVNNVKIQLKTLKELFEYSLNIPDYQRIYCWSKKNVIELLDDISGIEKEYRLGTVILHKVNIGEEIYNIVDGQQRLTTLSLILYRLGEKTQLLERKYLEDASNEYIKYNYYVIDNYLNNFQNKFGTIDKLKELLTFNVLIVEDNQLDLAYTFFSNVNSKGYPLSDFDLLKAHHLRFLDESNESQISHICSIWDKMLEEEQGKDKYNRSYEMAVSIYIYRLRKWLKYEDWDEDEKYRVKNEFEAAALIDAIPPFGEKFDYKEPIQGGTHFFNYINIFNKKYKTYTETIVHKLISENIMYESHWMMKDALESLLFAYYLKFGTDYIIEAMILITIVISKVRFDNARLYLATLLSYVKDTRIAILIEQATSPTFLLASLKNIIKAISYSDKYEKIRRRYKNQIINLFNNAYEYLMIQEIKKIVNNVMGVEVYNGSK